MLLSPRECYTICNSAMKLRFKKPKKPDLRNYWNFLLAMSRATVFTVLAAVVVFGLMLFKLSSLTPGLSEAELSTYQSASSLPDIADNMVNAPYKFAVYVATHVIDSTIGLRITGAVLGALSVIIFWLLVRRIFSGYIALASTAMYATNSLLLAASRQATPNVMLLSLLALIGTGFYLRFGKRHDIGWILAAAVIGLTLYVPGMVFFIAAAALWQFRQVRKSFEQLKSQVITTASVVLGVLITPLIINLIREPELWHAYLGLPQQLASFADMIKYAGTALISLYARSPNEPTWWLGRQPILDIFAGAMFTYGIWRVLRQFRLDRLWTLGGIFLLALLWIGASTNRLAVVILLPFVYILIGIGLQQLINKWTKVFPRNPIARWVGGLLLLAAIATSINFQSHRYYVAWPNNDETKAAFTHQYPS